MPNASNVAAVESIKGRLDDSVAALLTEYRGLKVAELGELRATLRRSDTEYKVLKNTLASIAAKDKGFDDLVAMLEGPIAFAFVKGDPVQAAKDLAEFARTHPALVVKGGLVEGRVLPADEVRRLATLESREVLLAKAAGLLLANLQQAVSLLAAPLRQVATMTAALRDKRQEAGETAEGTGEAGTAQAESSGGAGPDAVPAEAVEPEAASAPEAPEADAPEADAPEADAPESPEAPEAEAKTDADAS